MDNIFKQLFSAGGGAQDHLRSLFSGGLGAPNSQDEEDSQEGDELLNDEDLLENAKVVHDVFIQNHLMSTSHSVQWLPYQEADADYPAFTRKYFLLGTHQEAESDSNTQETVYVASVRVPKLQKHKK